MIPEAKERSSLLWLLSKAYKGLVPPDLKSPYFKESENQYRLKPDIVDLLSSCKLYAMLLRNLYDEPSFSELDFTQIFSMLTRKGIDVKPLNDGNRVKPDILEKCSPLNMGAHLSFADALIELFIREVLIPSKVIQVIQRFANSCPTPSSTILMESQIPCDAEEAALFWINRSAMALRESIHAEVQDIIPKISHVEDLADLSDGSALASLIALYCPAHISYRQIQFTPSTLADSLANHEIIEDFCTRMLPHNVHFLSIEDLLFPHSLIRSNVLAFIADLMYLFEIKPSKCVQPPGLSHYIVGNLPEGHREIPVTEL